MEIDIKVDRNDADFERREVKFSISYSGATPSKSEVLAEICKRLNISPEFAVITFENQAFGLAKSDVVLHAYQSKESMEKYESKVVLEREKRKAEKAKKAQEDSN
ncbi:MAG: hypothetical protein ACP5MX_01875 [Candidatus Micrarchaeia archaeon]